MVGHSVVKKNVNHSNNESSFTNFEFSMKTKIIPIVLSLFLLITFSCKKAWQETENNKPENAVLALSDMDKYLLDFRKQMDNTFKSGELLEPEDARWHLSAMLNFSYADAKSDYELLPSDTIILKLQLVDGQIKMQDFSNTFYEISSFLHVKYTEIEFEDKTLIFISVGITGQTDQEVELMAVSTMGYNSGLSWGYPFSEGHWWYWGFELGRCGDYEGLNIGSDAAKRLTFAANITVPLPGPGRVYWTDEYIAEVYAGDYPDELSPSGFKLFLSHIPIDYFDPNYQPPCLSPIDLNYYFNNILEFGIIMKPQGLFFIGYHVIADILMYNYQSFPRHTLKIYYGIPHITEQPYGF